LRIGVSVGGRIAFRSSPISGSSSTRPFS
jgi:hypothetical protein